MTCFAAQGKRPPRLSEVWPGTYQDGRAEVFRLVKVLPSLHFDVGGPL